jgi:hypothetical protein
MDRPDAPGPVTGGGITVGPQADKYLVELLNRKVYQGKLETYYLYLVWW